MRCAILPTGSSPRKRCGRASANSAASPSRVWNVIFITDREGRSTYVSPAGEKVFQFPAQEVVGKHFAEFLPPEDIGRATAIFNRALQGEPGSLAELKMRRKDGSFADTELSATQALTQGQVVGVQGIIRDVTERKHVQRSLQQAKDAAEAANRAKERVPGQHEPRDPHAHDGHPRLQRSADDAGSAPRGATRVLKWNSRNGQALLELIGDILDLSRIEADKLEIERTDCSLQQIIDDTLSVVQVGAREKQLSLEVDYQYPLPEITRTDPVRLRQILVNVLGNAVKFTQQGGIRIVVRCLQKDDKSARVQFAVSDTGIGIPPEKIGAPLPAVRAGRRLRQPALRRRRPGVGHFPAAGTNARRRY